MNSHARVYVPLYTWPAGQLRQLTCDSLAIKVPTAQLTHAACIGLGCEEPAAHPLHAELPVEAANVPNAHGRQTREPTVPEYW
jgi:hypothetical protein